MMMKRLFVSGLSVFLLFSCKKEITELPPATQTGAQTFGAKVNGNFWIPQGFGPIPADNLLEAKKLGPNFYINARNFASSPNETEFEIFLKDVNGTGNYPLNTTMPNRSTGASYGFYVKRKLSPISEWLTSAVHGGVVHISFLDTTNHIIAGTFNFSAADNFGTAPVLQVTEGRFDLNY